MKYKELSAAALLATLATGLEGCSSNAEAADTQGQQEVVVEIENFKYTVTKSTRAMMRDIPSDFDLNSQLGLALRGALTSWTIAFEEAAQIMNSDYNPEEKDPQEKVDMDVPICMFRETNASAPFRTRADLYESIQLDGHNMDFPAYIQMTCENAEEIGAILPAEGPGYFQKVPAKNQGKAKLHEASKLRFQKTALDFYSRTAWTLSYSDALDCSGTSVLNDTADINSTGQAIDIPDGRFKDPSGTEVTWSGNPEYRYQIENEFRPLIIDLVHKNGGLLYHDEEKGHFQVYFPDSYTLCID